jgi:Spy/CpxP family protein refolding chaperone
LFVCLTLSLLTLLWVGPAYAQGTRHVWWKSERFQKELALTPDQVSRIDVVFQAVQPALRAENRALKKLEDELSTLIAEARIDEAELAHFVVRVEAARADLSKTRTLMIFRIRRIMSAEQHLKLQKLFEQDEKDRRGHGQPKKQ